MPRKYDNRYKSITIDARSHEIFAKECMRMGLTRYNKNGEKVANVARYLERIAWTILEKQEPSKESKILNDFQSGNV